MREILKLTLRLTLFALIAGFALGGVYVLTQEPIAQQTVLKDNAARQQVLPGADVFEEVDLAVLESVRDQLLTAPAQLFAGKSGGKTIGFTVKTTAKGYGGALEMTVGVLADGTVQGVQLGSHTETPGLGAKAADEAFRSQYEGKQGPLTLTKTAPQNDGQLQAISGATITSRAVTNGVNDAIICAKAALEGGY